MSRFQGKKRKISILSIGRAAAGKTSFWQNSRVKRTEREKDGKTYYDGGTLLVTEKGYKETYFPQVVTVNGSEVELNIFDTAGNDHRLRSIQTYFGSEVEEADVYTLCLFISSTTYKDDIKYLKKVLKNDQDKKLFAKDCFRIIVTKDDLGKETKQKRNKAVEKFEKKLSTDIQKKSRKKIDIQTFFVSISEDKRNRDSATRENVLSSLGGLRF